jgi:hypothetical protein
LLDDLVRGAVSPLDGEDAMRFYVLGAQEVALGVFRRRLPAGTTIADTGANALAGHEVCPDLCSKANDRLVPLDAAAVAIMQAAGFANAAIGIPLSGQSSGADSVG